MLRSIWDKIPSFLKNRYTATLLLFAVWMLFFDQHHLISQMKYRMELQKLEKSKAYYHAEIEKTRDELEELLTNDDKLERFAREKYLMKKDEETVFVIVTEE